tara:strand:- start:780 stop:1019 length:240 start_codon:yes stop_codon:yes gene_type:complete
MYDDPFDLLEPDEIWNDIDHAKSILSEARNKAATLWGKNAYAVRLIKQASNILSFELELAVEEAEKGLVGTVPEESTTT